MDDAVSLPAKPAETSVSAVVDRRRSVRAFLPTPVDRALVEDLVRRAARAPSGSNVQPWAARIVAGEEMTALRAMMRDLRAAEPFTCVLITHDLRESVFLGDQVIVLSGRPARTQHVLDVDLPADRTIESLYTPEATDMLHLLRDQIRLAQGRDGGAH